ncbi:hypothetical protein [Novosphingobium jiangmenense]|uniref:Uncharacterized protein n=1 Tax=Novosphingobium jiangmenense TaxID=2791981 RepID=A0ABS0HBL3_9SPHN|nr:hypothetical protein [Novosphingobium jiangmenense]MBF9149665.1 hypothetical protein [Novosphingobium jiangmenense]
MKILGKIALATVLATAIAPAAAWAQAVKYDFSVLSSNGNNVVFSGYATKSSTLSGASGSFDGLWVTGYRNSAGSWVTLGSAQQLSDTGTATYKESGIAGVYFLNSAAGKFQDTNWYQLSGGSNTVNAGGFDFGFSPDSSFTSKESSNIGNNYKINNLIYATQFFNSSGTPTDPNGNLATQENSGSTPAAAPTASVPEIDGSKLGLLAYIAFVMMAAFQLRQRFGSLRGGFRKGAALAA